MRNYTDLGDLNGKHSSDLFARSYRIVQKIIKFTDADREFVDFLVHLMTRRSKLLSLRLTTALTNESNVKNK